MSVFLCLNLKVAELQGEYRSQGDLLTELETEGKKKEQTIADLENKLWVLEYFLNMYRALYMLRLGTTHFYPQTLLFICVIKLAQESFIIIWDRDLQYKILATKLADTNLKIKYLENLEHECYWVS